MEWAALRRINVAWWTLLLMLSHAQISSQQQLPTNTTDAPLLANEGAAGAGSEPYSGNSDSGASSAGQVKEDDASLFGTSSNKTFSTIQGTYGGPRVGREGAGDGLEMLSQGVSRLEGSLGSLMQNFLTLQRSVSNLEQLQELLVLLLEDILKQTSHMNRSPKTTKKSTHSKTSTETDDDIASAEVDSHVALKDLTNLENENGAAWLTDRSTQGLSSRINSNAVHDKRDPTSDPAIRGNQGAGPGEEEAGSKESVNSSEERDDSASWAKPSAPGNPTPQEKAPSRSPHWAEPMSMERPRLLNLLREALSHLGAHQASSDESQPLQILREDAEANTLLSAESTAEKPPPQPFEPLEVRSRENGLLSESRLPVRLRHHLSPVVSHGGPRDGPEKSTSPFLEDLSGLLAGDDDSGEHPTGMINDLQMPSNDRYTQGPLHTNHPIGWEGMETPLARKRRQVGVKRWQDVMSETSGASSTPTTIRQGDGSAAQTAEISTTLPSSDSIASISKTNEGGGTKHTSGEAGILMKGGHGEGFGAPQDYDLLIDTLLKDLSLKLKQHQGQLAPSDAAIDRAILELDKLIWVSTFDHNATDHRASSYNLSFMVQPIDSNLDHTIALPAEEPWPTDPIQMSSVNVNVNQSMNATSNNKDKGTAASVRRKNAYDQVNLAKELLAAEWRWLAEAPNAVHVLAEDLVWLANSLTALSQRPRLTEDIRDVRNRGEGLLQGKLQERYAPTDDNATGDLTKEIEEDEIVERNMGEDGADERDRVEDDKEGEDHDETFQQESNGSPKEPPNDANSLDSVFWQLINALTDSLPDADLSGNNDSDPPPLTSSSNENRFHPDLADHHDSEANSHEDEDDDKTNVKSYRHNGQFNAITEQRLQYILSSQAKSRHKRLSGLFWNHLLNPMQTHQDRGLAHNQSHSKNLSAPLSDAPSSAYHPYHRRLVDPWVQRFLRPYHHPLGYANNYMGHPGGNHPNWLHRAVEPDDTPPADPLESMDSDDIMAALFQRYWRRLLDVYSRSASAATTTEEPDLDGEDTTLGANSTLITTENVTLSTPNLAPNTTDIIKANYNSTVNGI